MFEMWMRILKTVDNSVLWLLGIPNQTFENNIRAFAEKQGVNKSRIFISEYAPIEEHLNRYRLCDLFLDTLYYTSSSTGIHALMMGMPIVTYRGETNAMRQGASVCHAAGLDETICDSMDEYFNLAVELANSPEKLQQLKNKLPINNPSSPYLDIKKDVGYMEKAYLQIWDTYIKQEKFTDIYID
jgi:protein O-GlcNAc transferase